MLVSLSIKNFALIEQLEIHFSNQFSIITGETGAGKSILLGALGLVLGNRADLTSLKDKEQKCVIEAQFDISNYDLHSFFQENDIDYDVQTIVRREILPSGKSRAFINDCPVNLEELKNLGSYLIDIHSQNQTLELSNEDFQMEILDAIGDNTSLLALYSTKFTQFKKSKKQLVTLQNTKDAITKEADYHLFLLQELQATKLQVGEQQDLETNLERLSNIELVKENLDKAIAILNEEQIGILQNVKEVKTALQKIAAFSDKYNELSQRISSVLIELDDIGTELQQETENVVDDPELLEKTNQKLQMLYSLQKKHSVASVEELIAIQKDLENKVFVAEDIDSQILQLESQLQEEESQLLQFAAQLTENRQKATPDLIQKISAILEALGMPNARFQFAISTASEFLPTGKDTLELLFSANKGTDFGLLKKVASGGEMSRIMLAVKSILANYSKLPTIIFDEIDTGVSGEIALKMGDIMKQMSQNMQVFAITHLPQIAAKGNQHYKVFKTEKEDSTISELKLLQQEERIIEIAEMLSGKNVSDSAINHAKALLN